MYFKWLITQSLSYICSKFYNQFFAFIIENSNSLLMHLMLNRVRVHKSNSSIRLNSIWGYYFFMKFKISIDKLYCGAKWEIWWIFFSQSNEKHDYVYCRSDFSCKFDYMALVRCFQFFIHILPNIKMISNFILCWMTFENIYDKWSYVFQ